MYYIFYELKLGAQAIFIGTNIVEKTYEYGIFINLDQENIARLYPTFLILKAVHAKYQGIVGTVIPVYFHEVIEETKTPAKSAGVFILLW